MFKKNKTIKYYCHLNYKLTVVIHISHPFFEILMDILQIIAVIYLYIIYVSMFSFFTYFILNFLEKITFYSWEYLKFHQNWWNRRVSVGTRCLAKLSKSYMDAVHCTRLKNSYSIVFVHQFETEEIRLKPSNSKQICILYT